MKLVCSKCAAVFESLIVDRQLALGECETKSCKHVKTFHKEVFEALALGIQRATVCLARLLHFDECVIVPEDDVWLQEQLEEAKDIVMIAIGFEPDGEDEDEEDEDSGDKELLAKVVDLSNEETKEEPTTN